MDQLAVGFHEFHLILDFLNLVGAELIQIQLVSERPEIGDVGARRKRNEASGLMIRDGGNVRADRAERVAVARSVLDALAFVALYEQIIKNDLIYEAGLKALTK